MFVTIILALTAMAHSAAISKSIRQLPSSFEPVTNRSALVHNFALVCVYDRDATNFCQKHFGYGCDSLGKKRTVLYDEHCDLLCQCIDLAPKPACMIGLTGQSWCLRAVSQDSLPQDQNQKQDQEVLIVTETSPEIPSATTDLALSKLPPDLVSSSPNMSNRLSRIINAAAFGSPSAAQEIPQSDDIVPRAFYRWAIFCASSDKTTTDCSRNGYYCDLTGSVRASNPLDQHCTDSCTCVDRLSMTTCFIDENGMIKCDEGGIKEEAVVRHIVKALPTERPILPREDHDATQIPHNFAMVCASDKQETVFCQQDGYYCDGNGKIVVPALSNKYCSDYCVCIDVGAKMYCMVANSGAMYCLRSEANPSFDSPDQIQQASFASKTNPDSTGKFMKREDEFQRSTSTSYHNSQSRDLDVPLHGENVDWGSHNMAMVCMNDRFFTNFCQDHGYYCTSSGYLVRKADGVENPGCEGNCQCIDLYPKPNCIMNLLGTAQCARDVEKGEDEDDEEPAGTST